MEDKKVLLSLKDLEVKFNVRGRVLTAIRGVSLDIYENEAIAIVGESGSGKSVLTKTFAGMLDGNGFISNGSITYKDDYLAETNAIMTPFKQKIIGYINKKLDKISKQEFGSDYYNEILNIHAQMLSRKKATSLEAGDHVEKLKSLKYEYTELFNKKQTLDSRNDKEEIKEVTLRMNELQNEIKETGKAYKKLNRNAKKLATHDLEFITSCKNRIAELTAVINSVCEQEISEETKVRNAHLAKEIYLTIDRCPATIKYRYLRKLLKSFSYAMMRGFDLNDEFVLNEIYDKVIFRVKLVSEDEMGNLFGYANIDLAKIKMSRDWQKIRGTRISTVFQDPMTSLNPIITIGNQITNVILKHQDCSKEEAKARAIELMTKVGIPEPEKRFNDYPFQYSGGMRQRIVIAIALSCQPKILICDEPTTALDVTIQAQIINLIKELQKEFQFTTIYITHDLGVVASVADRVAVLYAGQIVEYGKVEEIFYDPKHPYTWALLSSLPQLSKRGSTLYSIEGTPPSLYNKIIGDPFAPRNKYCLAIDLVEEPPYFQVSETHYAKTWLLDPRAPKVSKPEIIQDIHEKLKQSIENEVFKEDYHE